MALRRSPPQLAAFFFANPVAALRWSSEELGVDADGWPAAAAS